jgi:hypothetical protein
MNIGKRIISAFVEVQEEATTVRANEPPQAVATAPPQTAVTDDGKFRAHFDKLLAESNLPGPDYFEFTKMIEVMQAIPDEAARYRTAFAGLSVQGLQKEKLLETAAAYLGILDADAAAFRKSLEAALQDQVLGRQQEITANKERIRQLSEEITQLQNRNQGLEATVADSEQKISASAAGYNASLEWRRSLIVNDMEKIKQHIN